MDCRGIMENNEWLVSSIRKILPTLTDEQVENISSRLTQLGVETDNDLPFVDCSDLEQEIPLVKARKLIQSWKKKGV